MNNAETIAMTKAVKLAKGEKLEVGSHEVDFIVHVKGTVRKGEDYESRAYAAVPFDKMLAVALSKLNGVTVESILREALDESNTKATEIKEQAMEAIKSLVDAENKTMNGKTTATLTAEIIELGCPTLAFAV